MSRCGSGGNDRGRGGDGDGGCGGDGDVVVVMENCDPEATTEQDSLQLLQCKNIKIL